MFPMQSQAGASQYRPPQQNLPPLGMAPGLSSMNRILSEGGPPGLGPQSGPPGLGALPIGAPHTQHARQTSGSSQYELVGQPIQRPIGRSSSVKPEDGVDELSAQLGSSALLDDTDEPLLGDHRRAGPPGLARGGSGMSAFGASPIFGQQGQARVDGFGPGSSNASSAWGTPPSTLPFSQPGGIATMSPIAGAGTATSWSTPTGWGTAPGGLAAAKPAGFPMSGRPRPLTIRLHAANVFKHLIGTKMVVPDSWQELGALLRHVDQCVSPPVTPQELLDICDTEGNEHNGGGEFQVRAAPGGGFDSVLVRYVPGGAPGEGREGGGALAGAGKAVGGAGDIGSPAMGVSGLAGPAVGMAPPPGLFPGLGAHHAAGFH
jgi:hypothetical protein